MKADIFPIGLHLGGLRCLVVGGGVEADVRAGALLDAGARVVVVSTEPTEWLSARAADGSLELALRSFQETDLDRAWLAVLTDRDAELARRMAAAAGARRVFFCAVDLPDSNTYSHLAIARNGPLVAAISTNGHAPSLARRLREELERLFREARLHVFVARLAELRERTPSSERARVLGAAVRGVNIAGKIEVPEEE